MWIWRCEVRHDGGTFNALQRVEQLCVAESAYA
jgi:hypothetical protein